MNSLLHKNPEHDDDDNLSWIWWNKKKKKMKNGKRKNKDKRRRNFYILSRNAIKNIFSKEVNPLYRRQLRNIKRNECWLYEEIFLNPLIYGWNFNIHIIRKMLWTAHFRRRKRGPFMKIWACSM